jgi:hypothetical protein
MSIIQEELRLLHKPNYGSFTFFARHHAVLPVLSTSLLPCDSKKKAFNSYLLRLRTLLLVLRGFVRFKRRAAGLLFSGSVYIFFFFYFLCCSVRSVAGTNLSLRLR